MRALRSIVTLLVCGAIGCRPGLAPAAVAPPSIEPSRQIEVELKGTLPPPLDLRLGNPIGKHIVARPHPPFVVTVEQCHEPLQAHLYADVLPLPERILLGGVEDARFEAQSAAMIAAVREFYGLTQGENRQVHSEIALDAPAGMRATYTLHWDEIWDQNALQVLSHDGLVASLPLTVLTTARLVSETVSFAACPKPISDGSVPTREKMLAADESGASALVQEYLALLNSKDVARAYDLLAPEYQRQVPFERYAEGYEPLAHIEALSITSNLEGDQALVRAQLLIGLKRQKTVVSSTWEAVFRLTSSTAIGGYVWRIIGVEMLPTVP